MFPMIERVKDLAPSLTMTLILGEISWIDRKFLPTLKDLRGNVPVYVHVSIYGLSMYM